MFVFHLFPEKSKNLLYASNKLSLMTNSAVKQLLKVHPQNTKFCTLLNFDFVNDLFQFFRFLSLKCRLFPKNH